MEKIISTKKGDITKDNKILDLKIKKYNKDNIAYEFIYFRIDTMQYIMTYDEFLKNYELRKKITKVQVSYVEILFVIDKLKKQGYNFRYTEPNYETYKNDGEIFYDGKWMKVEFKKIKKDQILRKNKKGEDYPEIMFFRTKDSSVIYIEYTEDFEIILLFDLEKIINNIGVEEFRLVNGTPGIKIKNKNPNKAEFWNYCTIYKI